MKWLNEKENVIMMTNGKMKVAIMAAMKARNNNDEMV